MAVVKRTAQNTKALRTKRDKLVEKINKNQAELDNVIKAIEEFEAPIRTLTGGFSSEEVLAGTSQEPIAETVAPVEDVNKEGETEDRWEESSVTSEEVPGASVADEVPFKD